MFLFVFQNISARIRKIMSWKTDIIILMETIGITAVFCFIKDRCKAFIFIAIDFSVSPLCMFPW